MLERALCFAFVAAFHRLLFTSSRVCCSPVGWFTRIACDRRCNCTTWCKLPPRADARRPSAFHSSMAIFSPEIGFLLSASFPPFFLSLFLFFFFSFSRSSFGSFGSKFDSDCVSIVADFYAFTGNLKVEMKRERKRKKMRGIRGRFLILYKILFYSTVDL